MNIFIINKKSKLLIYTSLLVLFIISLTWNLYSLREHNSTILQDAAEISLISMHIILTHLFFLIFAIILTYFVFAKIDKDMQKMLQQKELLMKQSKHAQMGEMLGMIAHQWRQPLNSMSASAVELSMLWELKNTKCDGVIKHSKFIQNQTQLLSNIINDFMNFFKEEKNMQQFTIKDMIDNVNSLMANQLSSRGIKLVYDRKSKIQIYNYKKELLHVIVNIFSNARDAYDDISLDLKTIFISITEDEDEQTITIKDNAGGIPENIINNIFDPYFTTKEKGKGTGIGLSMTKMIVNEMLHGTIEVHNENKGAVFTIKLKHNN